MSFGFCPNAIPPIAVIGGVVGLLNEDICINPEKFCGMCRGVKMKKITEILENEKEFNRLIAAIDAGACPALVSGLSSINRAHIISALYNRSNRPITVICSDESEAKRISGDVENMTGKAPLLLLSREFTLYNAESASRQSEHARIRTLWQMINQKFPLIIGTADAFMQRTIPVSVLKNASMELEFGKEYIVETIADLLVKSGYTRCDQVEGIGQFAMRGGILDFFSPAYENPVRCEFFGDEIDSMGFFDISTQRRIEMIKRANILPVLETLPAMAEGGLEGLLKRIGELAVKCSKKKNKNEKFIKTLKNDAERLKTLKTLPWADRYMDVIYKEAATAAEYLHNDTVVFLCEPSRLKDRTDNYIWQFNEDIKTLLDAELIDGSFANYVVPWNLLCEQFEEYPVIMLDNFMAGKYSLNPRTVAAITTKQLPSYNGNLETAAGDIIHYMKTGYAVTVLCQDSRRADNLAIYLRNNGIKCACNYELTSLPGSGECIIAVGALSAGFEYPEGKFAVITEGQILERAFKRKQRKRPKNNHGKLESFTDLNPGDLVVHEHYGIGRFVAVVKRTVDKIEKDYIKISYAGTDVLYIPATQLDMISKYIGAAEDKPIKLSKMGGTDWAKAKVRAKGAVKELAKGLIELQAERRKQTGFAFSQDTPWQTEFEEQFEYQETDDQIRSISEIKKDMESPIPMDRLLCGDVGYGKTEVALRAVMKCVLDGKQAAILVPTTVLSQQHYVTAIKRFSGYPVQIEILSRFRTGAQLKKALTNIKTGAADIVIGTHKLLQKDVRFKDLGLLVVDEEQRFGVAHKERLKEISRGVDVLTLSATPIPRTLNMALSGIRDMSTIEEPPMDRQPVQTYVMEHNWGMICDAIRREISRGGQVYYLHNIIENIDGTAARISEMLGNEISVMTAHGKMDEEMLSEIMRKMSDGEIQVLVCTTIIETGIDIPNVNTLIIEDADKLGLAQLHQLRGRVGRSSRRAYAYFTFRQGKSLNEVAEKRLSAIREFAEFNSGFKIAMRDLEIRGAGNILGAEQSGHMMSVGYDMYLKLLEEAVLEEQGKKPNKKPECSADLTVSANIPEKYVPSSEQRMDLYRRIAAIRTEEDADDITDELIDRYGEPPKSVNTLIYIAIMRGEAADTGITEISQREGRLYFKINDFNMQRITALYYAPEYKSRLKIEAGTHPSVSLKIKQSADIVSDAISFIRAYKNIEVAE